MRNLLAVLASLLLAFTAGAVEPERRVVLLECENLPVTDKLITEGGCTQAYLISCYNGGGQKPDPVDYLQPALDGWAALPNRPKALNLSWFGNRTVSVVRTAGDVDPIPATAWRDGFLNGCLDYSRDLAHIKRLGKAITDRKIKLDYVLVNEETSPNPWQSNPEVWAAFQLVFTDPRLKSKAPMEIRDLWDPAVYAKFSQGWQGDPDYNRHQAGCMAWFKALSAKSLRTCLLEAGVIHDDTNVIVSFVSAPQKGREIRAFNGPWFIGRASLPSRVATNWQIYGQGWPATKATIQLSDSVRFFPTFHAEASVEDLAARALHCRKGFILYFGNAPVRDADKHIPVLRSFTALPKD